jgi:hypothetical protein
MDFRGEYAGQPAVGMKEGIPEAAEGIDTGGIVEAAGSRSMRPSTFP